LLLVIGTAVITEAGRLEAQVLETPEPFSLLEADA
jgi:hypothetical protein